MMVFDKMPKLPEELANMSDEELGALCDKIRGRLIEAVSENGGHLASNLGVVELTVALYSVYNPHVDRIVWDVGHQTYVHKILTGRDELMSRLRQRDGISGFPKKEESDADAFNTGHSSTSISAALGLARSYKIQGDKRHVIAVVGDGALTGGMAFEALNDAAQSKCNIIVVLNDNGMSIDKNVGGLSRYLSKLRDRHSYMKTKRGIRNFLRKVPGIGKPLTHFLSNVKNSIKRAVVGKSLFSALGFHYLGPYNGHDIFAMKMAFERANEIDGPVFIHVKTQKGRGYEPAEKKPEYYHGVSNFNAETGMTIKNNSVSMSDVFAKELIELAENDGKIVAVTAAMSQGTGLHLFREKFPERFFDVGIAEEHAITMAAGMSAGGMKPVATIYSTFLQRTYDQLLHDVAIQSVPLVVTVDRAGVCGHDGETHHGIYDYSFLGTLPRTVVFAPSCEKMLRYGIRQAIGIYEGKFENKSLFAIRYPARERFEYQDDSDFIDSEPELGKGRIVFDSACGDTPDVAILSIGEILDVAFDAAKQLSSGGKKVILLDALYLEPNEAQLAEITAGVPTIVTVEDAVSENGYGTRVKLALGRNDIVTLGFPKDETIKCDSLANQLADYGISAENIVKICASTNT